uniref:Uncharacterized protein n=2 Tax=Nicotiana TaxID=4085 RepID=A0A1S4A7K7_TOBAC|nr:PREDICTED: uncharacterized protein LOC104238926 [Nicotiana sylvestris]XP_016472622.1 PREDICTED: uncharacterized protein LOC107794626 [Nicotiana tabacum]
MRTFVVLVLVMLVMTSTLATSRNLVQNYNEADNGFGQGENSSVNNHHYIPRQDFNNGNGGDVPKAGHDTDAGKF